MQCFDCLSATIAMLKQNIAQTAFKNFSRALQGLAGVELDAGSIGAVAALPMQSVALDFNFNFLFKQIQLNC